jgi:hypothetical protein
VKRCFLLMPILLASVLPVHAQDSNSPYFRRFEIGWDVFSYLHQGDLNLFGGNYSFALRTSERLAFVGEGSFHANDTYSTHELYSYHFGPRFFAKPRGRVQPFIEVLAGGGHMYRSGSTSSSGPPLPDGKGFTLLAGGGFDMRVKPWFAWRTVQADYSFFHVGDDSSSGVRINTGILFRFGH